MAAGDDSSASVSFSPMALDTVSTAGTAALDLVEPVDTPALIVDIDRVRTNLDEMAGFCREHGVSLVPHAKTHRTPEFAPMQMDSGADALCTTKLGEAEPLSDRGLRNFVMAYPIVGPLKYAPARKLMRGGARLSASAC